MPAPLIETDDIEVLRDQFLAWMDGARARLIGVLLSENPHPERSRKGDAWENGWEVIDMDLEGLTQ